MGKYFEGPLTIAMTILKQPKLLYSLIHEKSHLSTLLQPCTLTALYSRGQAREEARAGEGPLEQRVLEFWVSRGLGGYSPVWGSLTEQSKNETLKSVGPSRPQELKAPAGASFN